MKRKLTIALVAILSSHAFAAIPSELPKLMNQQELSGFRDKLAQAYGKKEEKGPSEPSAFYTGKPYLASTDTYAFKYRNYNPALARWTSEDPSGFPDGANNSIYVAAPTFIMDPLGLEWLYYNRNFALEYKYTTLTYTTTTWEAIINSELSIKYKDPGASLGATWEKKVSVRDGGTDTVIIKERRDDPPSGDGWTLDGGLITVRKGKSDPSLITSNLGDGVILTKTSYITYDYTYQRYAKEIGLE